MKSITSRIINIDFDHGDSWLQATLPVKSGGLGLRSATILAPSAFLASADEASDLMQQLLPAHLSSTAYLERNQALARWKCAMPEDIPAPSATTQQKAWDDPIVQHLFYTLLNNCNDETSRSRVLGAATVESGAWLNALPSSSLGPSMPNDAVHIAIGLREDAPLCLPHTCNSCSKSVDGFGLHGLSFQSSQGRIPCHQMLKNIIYCSLASAHITSRLEPSGLYRADGNRSDGVTHASWTGGKFLVWDATCVVDTFCNSHKSASAREARGAAITAEKDKSRKYAHLDKAYLFQPIAVETCRSMGPDTLSFLRDLGRRLRSVTGEPQSFVHLLQRLSVAIQIGNTSSILGTMEPPDSFD